MKSLKISAELKDFIKKIIAVDIGLSVVAGILALWLQHHFGIILFGLGILCTVVGAYLGGPNSNDLENPRISHMNPYEHPSAEKLTARLTFLVKKGVPFYAFENVLLFAGVIAILLGLIILFILISSCSPRLAKVFGLAESTVAALNNWIQETRISVGSETHPSA